MITTEDIKAFRVWLKGWALALGALAILILLFAGIGRTVVTTGELATAFGSMN